MMLPKLIDDLEGRVKRSSLIKLPGSETMVPDFVSLAKKAEKFQFGEIPLEEHPTELLMGRPTWSTPEITTVEHEAWDQGLIPLPAPLCWYEYRLGREPSGFLVIGEPGNITIQRADYNPETGGVFTGVFVNANREGLRKHFENPKCESYGEYTVRAPKETLAWIDEMRHRGAQKVLNFAADHYLAMYLTLMLSSLTTEVVKSEPAPPKLNKAREKRGDCPLLDHHIVTLVPGRFLERGPGQGGGTHASPRLHWRRSHKRHLEKEPTAGRAVWMPNEVHRGKAGWWVTLIARQLVGVAERGTVTHEYNVKIESLKTARQFLADRTANNQRRPTMTERALSLKLAADCLEQCLDANIAPFIWGPPGVGKSDMVRQVARKKDAAKYGKVIAAARAKLRDWNARNQFGFIDIRLSLRDPVDLRGLPLVDAKSGTTRWLCPDELPKIERDGDEGILFLDECNHASAQMQAAAMGLVLDRRLGEYELPKGWVPVAAGNRLIDKAAANRMGTALRNRFAHFEVKVDLDAWCEWAKEADIDPVMIGFLRFRPELLHKMPADDKNSFPTPRSWAMAAKFCDTSETVRSVLIGSLVGEGPAGEFENFARMWHRLPDYKEIITNPKRAAVPGNDEPAVYYAVSAALSRRVTKDTLANVITYVQRLPKEFEIMTVTDAVKRDASLAKTKAYINWAVDNQEIVI